MKTRAEQEEAEAKGDKTWWKKGNNLPIIVMKDRRTGVITANMVPEKGANPYGINKVNDEIKALG